MFNTKRIIAFTAVVLLLSFSPSFPTSENTGKRSDLIKSILVEQMMDMENTKVVVSRLVPLLDVDLKNNYTLALFRDRGYAIITNQSLTLSEYALDDKAVPYTNLLNRNVSLIYGGPDNYAYTSDKQTFYDALTMEVIKFNVTKELKTINDILLAADPKNPTIEDLLNQFEVLKWTGIHESLFIRFNYGMWLNNPENYPIGNGICGPISVAIMMSFYQDNYDPEYVPNSVRTPGSADPGNLIYLLEKHIGGSYTGTIAPMIYYGLQQFLDSYHITSYHPEMTMLATWDIVRENVDKRHPIAVGLTNWAGSPDNYGNHWVTVYAYSVNSKNKGFYKAIDNHGNYKARINASWTIGAIWLSE